MILAQIASLAARGAVLLGLALAAMPLLRRAPSSARRLVLALGLGGALLIPAVAAISPAWRVATPISIAAPIGRPDMEPLEDPSIPAQAQAAAPAPLPAARPVTSAIGWSQIALAIWAIGAIVVLARLVVGLVRTRSIVRRSTEAPAWSAAIARAERATGRRAVVRETRDLDGPAVTGVIDPVVLVPRGSAAWSDDRRYAVLLHELAHVQKADCLAQIVAQIACAAHWFDPLAWIALRRFREERELAADDAVIAAGAVASAYAEDLLAIARAVQSRRPAPAGALGMADRSQLSVRIRAIVAADRSRRPLSPARSAILVASAGGALFAVACATPSMQESASAPSPSAAPAASAASSPPASGSTIDPALQADAERELERVVTEWQAAAGAIVVLDPSTGEILANAGRAAGAPADVATQRAYVTGSTLKAVTLAAALDEGVISPADRFDCENGSFNYAGKTMRDAGHYGVLTVPEMLAVSTNIGFLKVFDKLGGTRLDKWLRAFHFGVAPAIDKATAGDMPARIEDKSFTGAVVAIGERVTASPLQVAAAYATFANDGAYVAPTLVHRAGPAPREQLMKPETARAVVAMLEGVVSSERGTGGKARIEGVRVAGKTGTAEYQMLPGGKEGIYTSFVGLVPVEKPRFVILVGIENPREGASGGTVAAPAFAAVAARALKR